MWHKLLFWHVFSKQTEVSKVLSVYVCVINSRPRSEVWLVELRRLLSNKEVIVPSAKCEAHMWLVQEIWQSRSIQQSQNAYPFCTIARLNFRFSLSLGLAGVVERSVTPACLYVRAASCSPFHAFSLQAERCANRAANPQVFASLGNIIWLRCLPIHCISKFFDGGRCENHQKAKKMKLQIAYSF